MSLRIRSKRKVQPKIQSPTSSRGSGQNRQRREMPTVCSPVRAIRQAAQYYGMKELRRRFPDIGDATLRQVFAWAPEILKKTLGGLCTAPSAPAWNRGGPKHATKVQKI